MPLTIIRQDILDTQADAIVNPTNGFFEPGGGIDLRLHEAAGPSLKEACDKLGRLPVGFSKITAGYNLKSRFVIHTAGPCWQGGGYNEEELLSSCYRESLILAKDFGCRSVAFPLISSGTCGFPKDRVLKIAIKVISEFLYENELEVYLVVYDKSSYEISKSLKLEVLSYIDDNLCAREPLIFNCSYAPNNKATFCSEASPTLQSMIDNMDMSFSEALLMLVDLKGITDVDCYKRANASKQTWHKIVSDPCYKPSRNTAIAFCIALELDLEETRSLLAKAGYTLSRSYKFDVVIEYFIVSEKYDILLINETLFDMDLPLL